jgi:hypothetical protein
MGRWIIVGATEEIIGMKKHMHTYLFTYDGIDDFGSIQFCAQSKNEARNLFREWCLIDNNMKAPIEPISVQMVYDEQDALEYGDDYAVK